MWGVGPNFTFGKMGELLQNDFGGEKFEEMHCNLLLQSSTKEHERNQ